MADFGLKRKFRMAAVACLAAVGIMTANVKKSPAAETGDIPPNATTQLVVLDENSTDYSSSNGDWLKWDERQAEFLADENSSALYDAWLSQMDGAENLSLYQRLRLVDSLVNKTVTWTSDSANYHAPEHWASGAETVLSGKGDCDDYSIAKYYALQYLGVEEDRCKIMVVGTDTATKKLNHAVLAVDTSANNDWGNFLVLNNDAGKTLKTFDQTGYLPFYFYVVTPEGTLGCKVKKPGWPAARAKLPKPSP